MFRPATLLVVIVIVLLLVGARRLPELLYGVGRGINDLLGGGGPPSAGNPPTVFSSPFHEYSEQPVDETEPIRGRIV